MTKCPKCGSKCSCTDSRPHKITGINRLIPDRKCVRERRYECRNKECSKVFFSQEYLTVTGV